jgi:hypothetical protein
MVRAGFQRDVGCGAVHVVAERCCLIQGDDLSVVAGFVVVRAFPQHLIAACQHAADGGIRRRKADCRPRQL